MSLQPRDKTCKYDQISLGEVMLRLDPGEGRRHEHGHAQRSGKNLRRRRRARAKMTFEYIGGFYIQ
jgi:hypothetical protein